MKRIILAVVAAGGIVVGCGTATTNNNSVLPAPSTVASSQQASPTESASTSCNASLWDHVYHPDRLKVIAQCKTVTGIVMAVRLEPDGDTHIDLQVSDVSLVNQKNIQYQHGDLVLEQICQGNVTQADAISACQGVPHDQTIPHVGDHVTVTGSYVNDQVHGWMEIHPVTNLTVTS